MSSDRVSGVLAAVLTPFDGDGELDEARIPDVVDATVEAGCSALAAASTGVQETNAMSVDERERVVSSVVDAAPSSVPVFGGISHPALPVVGELIEVVEGAGADVLVAFPPWGMEPGPDEVRRYYEFIDRRAERPVLMYNNPHLTVDMPPDLMVELTELDRIQYIKETTRRVDKIIKLVEGIQHGGLANVFTTMDVFLITLMLGGQGVVAPPPVAGVLDDLYRAFLEEDYETAVSIQRQFSTYPPVDRGGIAVLKGAARAHGIDVGVPRAPYKPLTDDEQAVVADWVADFVG